MSDPLGRNSADTSVADTAYNIATAKIYDQLRFNSTMGRMLHKRELGQVLASLSHVDPNASILEVGCGTGRLLIPLKDLGYRVHGVDASGPMLEELGAKLAFRWPEFRASLADAAKLPFESESFDFTYAVRLLNQTASVEYALTVVDEMFRVTKPGGFLLVEFSNFYRPRLGQGKIPAVRLKPGEVIRRTRELGCEPIWTHGLFGLSMQAYHYSPERILWLVDGIDRFVSWLLPRLSSRCYVLLRRTGNE